MSCLSLEVVCRGGQEVVMSGGGVGGVVAVRPGVGVVCGARLSDPVRVIVALLLPVTAALLKVTHIYKIMFWEAL